MKRCKSSQRDLSGPDTRWIEPQVKGTMTYDGLPSDHVCSAVPLGTEIKICVDNIEI